MPFKYCGDCDGVNCPGTRKCSRYKAYSTAARSKANPEQRWASNTVAIHKFNGYIVNIPISALVDVFKTTPRCRYCNIEMQRGEGRGPKSNAPTLDRIDNTLYMTLDNTQIICHDCNATKLSRTHEEFIAYMVDVLRRFGWTVEKEENT